MLHTLNGKLNTTTPGAITFDERITVMACCNASGTYKLPLSIVGKFEESEVLNGIVDYSHPFYYKRHVNAWMPTELFEEWFHVEFAPRVKAFLRYRGLPPTAILFTVKYARYQRSLSSEGIRLEFLPINIATTMQPTDQGWFQTLKETYRKQLATYILNYESGVDDAMKHLSIHDVIHWMANAWNCIPNSTIVQAWKPLWPEIETKVPQTTINIENILLNDVKQEIQEDQQSSVSENDMKLGERLHALLCNQENYKGITLDAILRWLHPTTVVQENELLSDNEIIEIVTSEDEKGNNDPLNITITNAPRRRSLEDIQSDLENVIAHCKNNTYYTKEQLLSLIDLQKAMKVESLITEAKKTIKR